MEVWILCFEAVEERFGLFIPAFDSPSKGAGFQTAHKPRLGRRPIITLEEIICRDR